ncbi:MAG: FAD-binding protein, partial [Blautia sp.]|nr:FAD-binding protein [Blautia sp.]
KNLDRKSFLKGSLGLGLMHLLGSSVLANEGGEEPIFTPGTYTATEWGFHGDVTVEVTFDEFRITDVKVDASQETESVGGVASEVLAGQVMKAQGSAIDGVAGATSTSNAVRKAVAKCMEEASGGKISQGGDFAVEEEAPPVSGETGDWLGQEPDIPEEEISETVETDILVVGAGNAGLMCAARATELGASVLVIEKAMTSQTERHWIGALGTKEQEAFGTVIDKNKVVAELVRYASHRCDERLLRLWADHSGEAVDWYAAKVKEYNPEVEFHHEWDVGMGDHDTYFIPPVMHNFQDNIPEHDFSQETASYGLPSLTQAVLDGGGEIRYLTAMVKLLQEEGRVTGAVAKKEDGSYVKILAKKGVALCCGGYSGDKQMLATLNPNAYAVVASSVGSSLNTGDGIRAAMWLGADKDADPTAMLFDRGLLGPDMLPNGEWEKSPAPFHLGSQPWLKVNLRGERFCNESIPYDFMLHAGFMEPGHAYNSIFDSAWMEHVAQFQQIGCARIIPSKSGGKLAIFSPEAEMGLVMAMVGAGFIQQAGTLEELAEKLHLPVDTFVATVERYNELCEKGVDEDFGKEGYRMIALNKPPYYGARQSAQLLCTLDGLRINTQMQVLDKEGNPMAGLYAAGDVSGGFFAHNYPEYIVGVAIGRTLTEGYLLGEILAKGE